MKYNSCIKDDDNLPVLNKPENLDIVQESVENVEQDTKEVLAGTRKLISFQEKL